MRPVVGGAKLGGDRRPLASHWQAFLQEVLAGLREATVIAERAEVNLAVENHGAFCAESWQLLGAVVSTAALIEEQPETEEVSTALPSYGLSSVL